MQEPQRKPRRGGQREAKWGRRREQQEPFGDRVETDQGAVAWQHGTSRWKKQGQTAPDEAEVRGSRSSRWGEGVLEPGQTNRGHPAFAEGSLTGYLSLSVDTWRGHLWKTLLGKEEGGAGSRGEKV